MSTPVSQLEEPTGNTLAALHSCDQNNPCSNPPLKKSPGTFGGFAILEKLAEERLLLLLRLLFLAPVEPKLLVPPLRWTINIKKIGLGDTRGSRQNLKYRKMSKIMQNPVKRKPPKKKAQ